MAERAAPRPRLFAVARVVVGPPALVFVAWLESVRLRGPVTVSLTYPAPSVAVVVSDVLAVFVLATVALWAASILAGCRAAVSSFAVPVAASQLPMAAVALVSGRRILGGIVQSVVARHGEQLITDPGLLIKPVLPVAVGVLLLTALAVGVLYLGYRRATSLTGLRLPVTFVCGLLGAEVLSRAWFLWAQ